VSSTNDLRWDGKPGHYEVYYLTFTDPATGVGVWIRYTMVAPLPSTGDPATASLWFLAMDPAADGGGATVGRKASWPVAELMASANPFELRIGDATLGDRAMRGGFEDVSWDLRWEPGRSYEHVHPLLRGVASTVLALPHADIECSGHITIGERRLELDNVRGGQAHLWGSKHASEWAWIHCNDFEHADGTPADDVFVDGVSVIVHRFGRRIGPNTPFVGRVLGRDFNSRSAWRVITNSSDFSLTGWRFQVTDGARRLIGDVSADQRLLAGVTYHDPDGELAYCYNGETASMTLDVQEYRGRGDGWTTVEELVAPGRAHFEYATRTPVPAHPLLTT